MLRILMLCLLLCASAQAQDTTFTYQGQLSRDGVRFNGLVDLEFRIFDALSGGTQIGPTVLRPQAPVEDGLFQVDLDFGIQPFFATGRFLDIRADGVTLLPRQPIRPAPMAVYALSGNAGPQGPPGVSPYQYDPASYTLSFVEGAIGLRFVGSADPAAAPGVALGHAANEMPFPIGATISGGGSADDPNAALGSYATVGGGRGNRASDRSTIGGGELNFAASRGTVAGGNENSAGFLYAAISGGLRNGAAAYAAVPGGSDNCAGASFSFAAGRNAKVRRSSGALGLPLGAACENVPGVINGDRGTFVWSDDGSEEFVSDGSNRFLVRARGGARFVTTDGGLVSETNAPGETNAAVRAINADSQGIAVYAENTSFESALLVRNNSIFGPIMQAFSNDTRRLELTANGTLIISGALNQGSDRNSKTDIVAVDAQSVLDRLLGVEVSRWRYRDDDSGTEHIGPMAQDFNAAFDVGEAPGQLSSIDVQGVALAAIQALAARNAELEARIAALEARLSDSTDARP
jgi:hypothetical protein